MDTLSDNYSSYDEQTFAAFSTTKFGAATNALSELQRELQPSDTDLTEIPDVADYSDNYSLARNSAITMNGMNTLNGRPFVVGM